MIDEFAVVDVGLFFVPIWALIASGIKINLNQVSSFTEMGFIQKTRWKFFSPKSELHDHQKSSRHPTIWFNLNEFSNYPLLPNCRCNKRRLRHFAKKP